MLSPWTTKIGLPGVSERDRGGGKAEKRGEGGRERERNSWCACQFMLG